MYYSKTILLETSYVKGALKLRVLVLLEGLLEIVCSTTVSDCESVLLSQYAMMLKRHLRRETKSFLLLIKTKQNI